MLIIKINIVKLCTFLNLMYAVKEHEILMFSVLSADNVTKDTF